VLVWDLSLAASYRPFMFGFGKWFLLVNYLFACTTLVVMGRLLFSGITKLTRSVTDLSEQTTKNRFSVNIALISIFSALWVVLNLTVAPLGFAVFHLPVVHSLIIFFMLVLVTWATGQYGAASVVSIIGSMIVVISNPQVLPVLGFVPAAFLFDLVLLLNHHNVNVKLRNIALVVFDATVCAYVAAVVNGFVILYFAWMFTLTVWAGWNVLGGIIGVVIALPIVGVLEKAQVKRVKIS
jgi:hypothetical protein